MWSGIYRIEDKVGDWRAHSIESSMCDKDNGIKCCMRKGFLLESTIDDRRKKRHDELEIMPDSSRGADIDREIEEHEEDFCNY